MHGYQVSRLHAAGVSRTNRVILLWLLAGCGESEVSGGLTPCSCPQKGQAHGAGLEEPSLHLLVRVAVLSTSPDVAQSDTIVTRFESGAGQRMTQLQESRVEISCGIVHN